MIGWIIAFLIIAALAALFGFGGIVQSLVSVALILFWIFLALFLISVIFSGFRHIGHHTHVH